MRGIQVREETPGDAGRIRELLAQAFPSDAEAGLVEALRGRVEPWISLVAEGADGDVVGHILFTPVELRWPGGASRAVALGPMAVAPAHQRRGVGSALVEAGLAACRAAGEPVVLVLGHPAYYPRFGFRPAWDDGLYYGTPGPDPAFMVRELEPGALRGRRGEVVYHAAFRGL